MSNFVFNVAKGKVNYYAGLPGLNDALIAVALETTDLEADATMKDRVSLSSILTVSNEQTTVGRTTLAGVAASQDNTADTGSSDADDFTLVGATGAPIGAFVVCYVPDDGVSTESDMIPLTKHDFSAIPTGTDIPVQISSSGFFVASEPD